MTLIIYIFTLFTLLCIILFVFKKSLFSGNKKESSLDEKRKKAIKNIDIIKKKFEKSKISICNLDYSSFSKKYNDTSYSLKKFNEIEKVEQYEREQSKINEELSDIMDEISKLKNNIIKG